MILKPELLSCIDAYAVHVIKKWNLFLILSKLFMISTTYYLYHKYFTS